MEFSVKNWISQFYLQLIWYKYHKTLEEQNNNLVFVNF
jgi:hypothetical protein